MDKVSLPPRLQDPASSWPPLEQDPCPPARTATATLQAELDPEKGHHSPASSVY